MKDLKKIQEFFSKPLEEAELKLGVKYELPNGDTGYIMTQSSDDPKEWIFSDGFKKVPYLSVKSKLKPLATQPGKYDGAFDLGLGKGHHIDERIDDEDFDSLEDAIANREFGMDYNQLGPNEKEWVRDEMSMNERIDLDEDKTSAVYTDPNTGKKYILQYVSTKKRWELDIMKKDASIYSNAITTIKRDTIGEIKDWLDGYNIDSTWIKGLTELLVTENLNPEVISSVNRFIKVMAKRYDYSEQDAVYAIMQALKKTNFKGINEAKEEDKIDIVTMDVPLFIRALEYAKEDAQEDMDLHDFAERAIAATKEQGILQMDDYDMLVGSKEPMDESNITEASVPSNIKSFAKRKGVTALVNKVAGWAEKVGARISGGTAIGYNYSTLVLDMKYQAGEIRINTDNDTIKLYNEPVNSFPEFKKIYDEENPIDETKINESVQVGDRVKIKKEYGGAKGEVTDKNGSFIIVNNKSYHESDVEKVNTKTNENVAQTLAETIKLGQGVIEEELCPAGKAYIKRRQAAGEKSSAYLSGRAVKVCKGQMSGTSKKKTNESLINKDQKPTQKLDNLLNKIKKDFNIDNE